MSGQEQEQQQEQQQEGGEQQQQREPEQTTTLPRTAEELNEIIQARIERERSKFSEAVAKAEELDKIREGEKTETQRLADSLAESDRKRAEAEAELQRVRLDRTIEAKAIALGFVDPEAASAFIDRAAVKLDDDGNPDPVAVEAALKALMEAKPYLRGQRTSGSADQGVRGGAAGAGNGSGSDMNELLRRALGR